MVGTVRLFLPDEYFVSRVFQPLSLALCDWLRRRRVAFTFVPPRQQARFNLTNLEDVAFFIGIDTFTGRQYPFSRLPRGALVIIYQTEPLAVSRCWEFGWDYLRRAVSQLVRRGTRFEVWDYSAANVKAMIRGRCMPPTLALRLNQSTMRHLPPGYTARLVVGGSAHRQHVGNSGGARGSKGGPTEDDVSYAQTAAASTAIEVGSNGVGVHRRSWDGRLAFLGHSQYRHAQCWRLLNGSDGWLQHGFVTVQAWTRPALGSLLRSHLVWANLHQHCGDASSPLEAFRLVSLLSNGAACLSEVSDEDDARLFEGLVTFCNFSEMRTCHVQLRAAEQAAVGGVAAARAARARAFARRFSVENLCARVRCTEGVLGRLLRPGVGRQQRRVREAADRQK